MRLRDDEGDVFMFGSDDGVLGTGDDHDPFVVCMSSKTILSIVPKIVER